MHEDIINLMEAVYGKDVEIERLARLNNEQRNIVINREQNRKEALHLLNKLRENDDPEFHQYVFDTLRDMEGHDCEHGRHSMLSCAECYEIDRLLYPEFHPTAEYLEEDEEQYPETD